jgi:cell division septation protein DedD
MRTFFALLLIALFAPSVTEAATLNVPSQYSNFNAAYVAARDGDEIVVAPGTYGPQAIPSGTKRVTIKGGSSIVLRAPSASSTPTFAVAASNLTIDGVNVDGADHQRLGVEFGGSNNVYKNSTIKNITNEKGMLWGSGSGGVLDNMVFQDIEMTTAGEQAGVHMECLYSQQANLTIKNSRFTNCAVMDVFFTRGTWWGQPEYGGWTLTNNYFDVPRRTNGQGQHYYSVSWAWQSVYDRAVVRNNTYLGGVSASARFTNSFESCNSPAFNLAGMVVEPCGPTPTPTPTPTATPTPTPTPTATPTPTPTPTATPTPTPTPTATPTPTPTATPYAPLCAPTCDEQIEALKNKIEAAKNALG